MTAPNDAFRAMLDHSDAPDVTNAVLARLGHSTTPPRRRYVQRGLMILVVLGAGIIWSTIPSTDVSEPVAPVTTIGEAVREDVTRQQDRLRGAVRTIRSLRQVMPARPGYRELEPAVERSGMGPVDDLAWRSLAPRI